MEYDKEIPKERFISPEDNHSTKLELRFCAGQNPAHGMSEIHDGEYL